MKYMLGQQQQRLLTSFFLPRTTVRLFTTNNGGGGINPGHPYNVNEVANTDEATKQRILAREKEAFESLSEKDKQYY